MIKMEAIPEIPESTAAVAKAAFPRGNRYMLMRDQLGTFFADQEFADLFAKQGQPGITPWRLALVQIFAYMEDLSDERAADAVRSRIDWKYALSLELSDKGFDAAVLSDFRCRLVEGGAEALLFEKLVDQLDESGYLKKRGRQRTDATHVLSAARAVNRLVLVGETMRHALNVLATSAPAWLQPQIEPGWLERYEKRFDDAHLPKAQAEREALMNQIGEDGRHLLQRLFAPETPKWLHKLPAVRLWHRLWVEQYVAVADTEAMCRREASALPPAGQRIHTPYDPDARYAKKRTTEWMGYKVHLSESCDDDLPHLVTNVLTTPATQPDFDAAVPIHQALADKERLPAEHLLDAGYVDSALLVESQAQNIQIIGPVAPDHSWQALTPDAHDISYFHIDWESQSVRCPQGHLSRKWSHTHDKHENPIINIRFAPADCLDCPLRARCTRSATQPRHLTLRPQQQFEALQQRRLEQQTPAFQKDYHQRAGVEGTISQAVRTTHIRRSRYFGFAKTALHNFLAAAALNLYRITDWLAERPRSFTRTSAFARLALNSS
jgi:transposase